MLDLVGRNGDVDVGKGEVQCRRPQSSTPHLSKTHINTVVYNTLIVTGNGPAMYVVIQSVLYMSSSGLTTGIVMYSGDGALSSTVSCHTIGKTRCL